MTTQKTKTHPLFTLILLMIAAWVTNLISQHVRTAWEQTHDLTKAMNAASHFLDTPLNISMHQTDLIATGSIVLLISLIWLYQATNQRNYRNGEEHGSAQWGTHKDIAPYMSKNPNQNLQMTQTEALNLDTHTTRRNLNTLVIGSSGSGKTRGYVLPNLTTPHNLSYAITDPKGEILETMQQPLTRMGYQIRTLNLVELENSNHFNPLAYINPDQPEPAIMRLVENLITNTDGQQKNNDSDPFWTKAERALLTALTTWAYYTEENPTLTTVIELLGKMEASETNENHMSEVDAMMAAARELLTETRGHENEWDSDVNHMIDGLNFATGQYRTFEQGAGETKKSIIISAGVRLAPLQVRQIRDLITSDDIDLHSIGKEKTAIFLIIPDTEATFNFLAAIFYQCLFETLIRDADLHHTELPIPVHCFLDEFANLGSIPGFVRLIATMRSRGISASIIIQNIAQLKAHYKDDWETIVGNCDSKLFLGGAEESTTKMISTLLGKQTIDIQDTSESKGTNGNWTISNRKAARELLTPDELAKLDDNQCIYLLRGINPFLSQKIEPKLR